MRSLTLTPGIPPLGSTRQKHLTWCVCARVCVRARACTRTHGLCLPQLELFNDYSKISPDCLLQEWRYSSTHSVQVNIFLNMSFPVRRVMSPTYRPLPPRMHGADIAYKTRLTKAHPDLYLHSFFYTYMSYLPPEQMPFESKDHIFHSFMNQS